MYMFLGLNLVDGLLTYQLIAMGAAELNWYRLLIEAAPVWGVMLGKMMLAGVVVYLLWRFRKKKLFKPLNIGMALIVGFNIFSLITYL